MAETIEVQSGADPTSTPLSLDTIDIIGPHHYAANGYPHREWTYLRKHHPVAWITYPNTDPFWAITKHADIVEISKQPNLWEITKRLLVFVNEAGAEANPNPVG